MGFIEIKVWPKHLDRMRVGRPKKKTVPETWTGFAVDCLSAIGMILETRLKQTSDIHNVDLFEEDLKLLGNEKMLARDTKSWENLARQLQLMIVSIKERRDPWIYDCKSDADADAEDGPVVFKPVIISQFCEDLLWRNFDFVMLMSATLISPAQRASDLGISVQDMGVVTIPYTFDPARSPFYIIPIAKNTYEHAETNFPVLFNAAAMVCKYRPSVRILVHAVSYKASERIARELQKMYPDREIITHQKGMQSKNAAIEKYKRFSNAVMVSPAMGRGVDFAGDLLRVQILPKTPSGNLSDKQIKTRLYGTANGQNHYAMNTVGTVEQMHGRGMRNNVDWCETFAFDVKMADLYREYNHMFDSHFKQQVIEVNPEMLENVLKQGFGAQFA